MERFYRGVNVAAGREVVGHGRAESKAARGSYPFCPDDRVLRLRWKRSTPSRPVDGA